MKFFLIWFFIGVYCVAYTQVADTGVIKTRLDWSVLKLYTSFTPGDGNVKYFEPSVKTLLSIEHPHLIQKHQPFFCRIESNLERKSILAPRFRLGGLDYVNWLEGKVPKQLTPGF